MNFTVPAITAPRVVNLVVVFLMAAIVTVGLLLLVPPSYQASGSVFLSRLHPPASSTSDLAFEATQFEAALSLDRPTRQVAAATGQSASAIKQVQATEEGQGSVVDLSYVAAGQGKAAEVLRYLTTVTAVYLAQQDVDSANVGQREASQQLDSASAAISNFNASVGYQDLNKANATVIEAVQSAQAALSRSPGSSRLTQQLRSAEADAARVTSQVNLQAQLESVVTQASEALTSEAAAQASAQVEIKAASANNLLVINNVTRTGRISLLGKGVLGAAVVVGLLGFFGFGYLDSRQPLKRTRKRTGTDHVSSNGEGNGTADPDFVRATNHYSGDAWPVLPTEVGESKQSERG